MSVAQLPTVPPPVVPPKHYVLPWELDPELRIQLYTAGWRASQLVDEQGKHVIPSSKNPYEHGTAEWHQWFDGWLNGQPGCRGEHPSWFASTIRNSEQ